ncbi:MAG: cadherin-like domain-containing protein [Planctomycetes bacterium]|nr:cadherin-like domain-containing protein [Planctomycetota bacterium]
MESNVRPLVESLEQRLMLDALPMFQPVEPLGALLFETEAMGTVAATGEHDVFTFSGDAGHTISVAVRPRGSLMPSVALRAGQDVLATAAADGAGGTALLQLAALPANGEYTLDVAAADDSTGDYELVVLLDGYYELDTPDGSGNASLETAVDLDSAFMTLPGGSGERAVALTAPSIAGESFDFGTWGRGWTMSLNGYDPFVEIADGQLTMGKGSYAVNKTTTVAATWTVDLSGLEHAFLTYTSSLSRPSSSPSGHTTGIAIRDDIHTWHSVWGGDGHASPQPRIDLVAEAQAAGIELGPDSQIMFQGHVEEDFSRTCYWDNLLIHSQPVYEDWYSLTLDKGDSTFIKATSMTHDDIVVELYDSDGTLLTTGFGRSDHSSNTARVIAPEAGRYYVRVIGQELHRLLVTRNAAIQDNLVYVPGQQLLPGEPMLGACTDGGGYDRGVQADAGESIEAAVFFPIFQGRPVYDLYGTLRIWGVATDTSTDDDPRNLFCSGVATDAGSRNVRFSPAAGGTGEFVFRTSGEPSPLPAFEVQSPYDGENVELAFIPRTVTVMLNRAVLASSVDAADLTVDGIPATGFHIDSPRSITFDLPDEVNPEGTYTLRIAPEAMVDTEGAALEGHESTMGVDYPPCVIASSIQDGQTVDGENLTITIQFSEPITVLANGVFLRQGTSMDNRTPESSVYDPATSTLTLTYSALPAEGSFTFMLYHDKFRDAQGRGLDGETPAWPIPDNRSGDGVSGGNFIVQFWTDTDTMDLTGPFEPVGAFGSLAYEAMVHGGISLAGDSDTFTLRARPGQLVTFDFQRPPTLTASITLTGTNGPIAGTVVPTGEATSFTAAAPADGVISITVAGDNGTTGPYDLGVLLNAMTRVIPCATIDHAVDIDDAFTPIGPRAALATVLGDPWGKASAAPTEDWYRFSATAGQTVALRLAAPDDADGDVELYDSAGRLLAVSRADGCDEQWGADLSVKIYRTITDARVPADGAYFIRVTGEPAYTLWAAKDAALEIPAPATLGAQDISLTGSAVGYLPGLDGSRVAAGDYEDGTALSGVVEGLYFSVLNNYGGYISGYVYAGTTTIGGQSRPALIRKHIPVVTALWSEDTSPLRVVSTKPLTSASIDVFSETDGAVGVIRAYDANGRLLGEVFSSPLVAGAPQTLTVSTAGAPIKSLRIAGVGADAVCLDNLIVDPLTVRLDAYAVDAEAGAALTLSARRYGLDATGQDSTFVPAIELYDPTGALVATDANDDGSPDAAVAVTATATGTYTVRVISAAGAGGYVLEVDGGTPADVAMTATSSTLLDGARRTEAPASITLDFSGPLALNTLEAGDLTVNGAACAAVTVIDCDTVEFTLPALSDGTHDLAIAPDAIAPLAGGTFDGFTLQFVLDLLPPTVTSITVTERPLPMAELAVEVQFSEPLDTRWLEPSSVSFVGTRSGAIEPSTFSYDPTTSTLAMTFVGLPAAEADYTLTLFSSRYTFCDRSQRPLDGGTFTWPVSGDLSGDGVEGGAFILHLSLDYDGADLSYLLAPAGPFESGASRAMARGSVDRADADTFTIDLLAGQILALAVTPASSWTPVVSITDANGDVVAEGVSKAAGVLCRATAAADGTYTLHITAADNGGDYIALFLVDAEVEPEFYGLANDTRQTAQPLDDFLTDLDGARLATVVGDLPVIVDDFETWGNHTYLSYYSSLLRTHPLDPIEGNSALWMPRSSYEGVHRNAWMTVNLADAPGAILSFSTIEITDADHLSEGPPARVEIRANGTSTWHKAWTSPDIEDGQWQRFAVDLDAAAAAYGIAADAVLDVNLTYDGDFDEACRGFDDVLVARSGEAAAEDWYSIDLQAGEALSVTVGRSGKLVDAAFYDADDNVPWPMVANTKAGPVRLRDFVAPADGTYYVRIAGTGHYTLAVAVNAATEMTDDTVATTPRDITPDGGAIGYVGVPFIGADPGRYADGTDLHTAVTGITLNGMAWWGQSIIARHTDDLPIGAVFGHDEGLLWKTGVTSPDGPTGTIFDQVRLTADFAVDVTEVSIVVIADDDGDRGTLQAYDSEGTLLETVFTTPMAAGEVQVLTIHRDAAEIASIVAGGADDTAVALGPLTASGQAPTVDAYAINASAGDTLSLVAEALPSGASTPLVPALALYAPDGTLVGESRGEADGSPASLTYTVQAGGAYRVEVSNAIGVGRYYLSADGATGMPEPFTLSLMGLADGSITSYRGQDIQVIPSISPLLPSPQLNDWCTVNGDVFDARWYASVGWIDVDYPEIRQEGYYEVQIPAWALVSVWGRPSEALTVGFWYDVAAPRVTFSSVQDADVRPSGALTWTLRFDTPLASGTLDAGDIVLAGVDGRRHASDAFAYDAATATLTVAWNALPQGVYQLELLSGPDAAHDPAGRALDGEAVRWPIPMNASGDGTDGGDFRLEFRLADGLVEPATPHRPTAANDRFEEVYMYSSTELDVLANDTFAPDRPEWLTIVAVTQPRHGEVILSDEGTRLTYYGDGDHYGTEQFTYTIEDEDGLRSTATVTLDVVGDGPVIESVFGTLRHNPWDDYTDNLRPDEPVLLLPGARVAVPVSIHNIGDMHWTGPLEVRLSLEGMEEGLPENVPVTSRKYGSFRLNPDARFTNTIAFIVPVNLPPGRYYLSVEPIDPATGEPDEFWFMFQGDSLEAVDAWAFGTIPGHGNHTLTVPDRFGTPVSYSLRGGGYGMVTGLNEYGLHEIGLFDTDLRSSLTIRTAGRGSQTLIDGIEVAGSLGSIVAPTTDLFDTIDVGGALRSLTLDDAADFLNVGMTPFISVNDEMGEAHVSDPPAVSIRMDNVQDLTVQCSAPIASVVATQWLRTDDRSYLAADSIGTIRTTGARAVPSTGEPAWAGDFDCDVYPLGADRRGSVLGSIRVAGSMAGTLQTEAESGRIGPIVAGATAPDWMLHAPACTVTSITTTAGDLGGSIDAAIVGAVAARGDLKASIWAYEADAKTGLSIGRITASAIRDIEVHAAGGVGLLQARQWDGRYPNPEDSEYPFDEVDDRIAAGWIGKLIITGDRRDPQLDGSFAANVELTGQDRRGWSLGAFAVAGMVTSSQIDLAGPAGTLAAGTWGATIVHAAWVDSFTGGGFTGGLYLRGANARGLSAGKITIAERADHAVIHAAGGLGAVVVGAIDHCEILAGVADGVSGAAVGRDDFLRPEATIGLLKVTGLGGAGRFFVDSRLAAPAFGTIQLCNVDYFTGSGGIIARTSDDGPAIARMIIADTDDGTRWVGSADAMEAFPGPDDFIRLL